MENRFFEMGDFLDTLRRPASRNNHRNDVSGIMSMDWSGSMSVANRVLLVLIENGGVDLGIPELVDKLLSQVKVITIPDSVKAMLVEFLRKKIKSLTDNLIETAELTANRYTAAKPDFFGEVLILRNGTATYNELKDQLIRLTKEGRIIDLLVLTHGSADYIALSNNAGIDGVKIRDIQTANKGPLNIRSVYMMNCVGSTLNKAWLDIGARVSSGAIRNNYLPEPSTHFFWTNWKEGQGFEAAVTNAYRKTINLMNEAVKEALRQVPLLSSVAGSINFENFDFVKDSAPVIQGQRTVTIQSDELSFGKSLSNSLATTVLPVTLIESLSTPDAVVATLTKPWKLSGAGISFLKKQEGFRANLYDDATGNCTIGYGTLVHNGKCNGGDAEKPYLNGISDQEAGQLLLSRSAQFEKTINEVVTVDLKQSQFDALLSFVYNVGPENFKQSTLLKRLNAGKFDEVPVELKKWTKGRVNGELVDLPGLVKRRQAEALLFTNGGNAAAQSLSLSGWLAASFAGVNFTVAGPVPEIQQPSGLTCWAAVITSMICWKRRQSMKIRDALATIGSKYVTMFDNGQVLDVNTAKALYKDAGLEAIISQSFTIEGWEGLLKQYGPLYVDIGYPGVNNTHAIIVTGIAGGGEPANTNITYIDPAQGKSVTISFKRFLELYEAPSAVNTWPYVIVHWPAAANVLSGQQSLDDYSRPFYDTGEHALFGQFINNAVSGPIAAVHALQPSTTFSINTVPFTYGQIITMGDFYETYKDFVTAPAAELTRLKTLVQRSENHYKNTILGIGSPVANPDTPDWKSPTSGIGPRYLDLALKNNSHFAPPPAGVSTSTTNNRQTWESYHAKAIQTVRSGNNSSYFDQAYPINAFGDHFLTDAFSAGHLINKEQVLKKFIANCMNGKSVNDAADKMFEKVAAGALAIPGVKAKLAKYELTDTVAGIHPNLDTTFPIHIFYRVLKAIMEDTASGGQQQIANLSAKAIHDYLNNYTNGSTRGVPVKNNKGMSWNLSGDATLNWSASSHINNLEIIQLAVKQSVENLSDAVSNMSTPVSALYQKVWDYVPNINDPTTRGIVDNAISIFTNPSSPQLIGKAVSLIESEIDTLLDALLAAKKIKPV